MFAALANQVAELLLGAEEDLLGFHALPKEHWSKLRSPARAGQPRDRPALRRRQIFPNDAALIRLAGALLIEQCDEWLVSRRYLSVESLALALEGQDEQTKEVRELQAA